MSHHGTALITGASAGIGKALAATFAAHGHDLVLVARRGKKLQSIAVKLRKQHGVSVTVMPADLAEDGAVGALCDALEDIDIDILVNNAGVLAGGSFRRMPEDRIDSMLRVNVVALTGLCRRFAEIMAERGSGRILNIASIGAFQPVPSLAVYAAGKAYVLSLSEALAVELRSHGVTVTVVCPGFTDTNMIRQPSTTSGKTTQVSSALVMSPEQVAEDAYRACMAGTTVKIPGAVNALAMATTRLLPRWVLRGASALALRSGHGSD